VFPADTVLVAPEKVDNAAGWPLMPLIDMVILVAPLTELSAGIGGT
jgi:hypothetical protein